MASQSPTVEEMLQQMLIYHQATKNAIQDYLVNRSNTTNVRLKVERVESVELSNSMAVYPAPIPVQQTNPLASTSSTSDKDNNESSIANPDNEEDLARVLDEASETPVLSKRNSSIDVLVDSLNVQLNRPSTSVNSINMMAGNDAKHAEEFNPIHPQALYNWQVDSTRQELYVTQPSMFIVPNPLHKSYDCTATLDNVAHKEATTIHLHSITEFQAILTIEAGIGLAFLAYESEYTDLPFITDDEALILRDSIAPINTTIRKVTMPTRFPGSKLRLLNEKDLQKLLTNRCWQYHRSAYNNFDQKVDHLRAFVMFVYHGYIDPTKYQPFPAPIPSNDPVDQLIVYSDRYYPSISMHNFNDLAQHYDDFVLTDGIGRENELHERLERISGLNLLDSALHSDCVVTSSLILQDGSSIECRTLADTGCAQQCFMSEGHFLKYPILQQYLVKHPTNTIDLATHGSTAVVSKYISVVLEIVHRGKPIRCKIVIGIMKGLRYDLVLSLVVIASHYVDVLVDLLNVQLNRPTFSSSNSISMIISQDVQQAAEFSPMQCAQSPLPSLEGEDSASVERSYSEILFHGPLNPQGLPLVMVNLQDPDSSTADIDIDDSPTTSSIAASSIAASPKRSCEDMSN